jgi:hypothetical protein
VPFLRLTRDRRGFENTYLMHADRPGDRPRILYWYRTAPGIMLGRPPLDEDAIRAIEDQHPDIEFDWPAILALSEVMTPEDEAPPPRLQTQPRKGNQPRKNRREPRRDERAAASAPSGSEELRRDDGDDDAGVALEPGTESSEASEPQESSEPRNRLLEELAGREIGARLRARHAEIVARIESLDVDGAQKDALFKRAEAIDPELWMTPEAVLAGVSNADALYEKLKADASRD